MARRTQAMASGILLSVAGLVILGMAGSRTLMGLFGGQILSGPQVGDVAWVGVAFTRVFGAALAGLGLIMMATRQLSDAAAKTIGGPIFVSLALVALVASIQAHAIWKAPAGWVLVAVILAGGVGAGQLAGLPSESSESE